MASLQVVLEQGHQLDWWESHLIRNLGPGIGRYSHGLVAGTPGHPPEQQGHTALGALSRIGEPLWAQAIASAQSAPWLTPIRSAMAAVLM
ncbi:MAG: hypothetical protein VKN56_09400 [Cyanobacteriota bacterium]|nr:hypothetical protein [Cyanobacteriota bacterium]